MRNEFDFQKYSQLLGQGLFADNVILSILDYRENNNLNSKGQETLQRAKAFFDVVINGGNLQSSKLSSADDVKAAKAFTSLQSSIKIRGTPSQELIEYISELRDTIDDILQYHQVNEEKIKQLDEFFSFYSRIQFQKSQIVFETA